MRIADYTTNSARRRTSGERHSVVEAEIWQYVRNFSIAASFTVDKACVTIEP